MLWDSSLLRIKLFIELRLNIGHRSIDWFGIIDTGGWVSIG